jgi:hypothetical protein
MIVLLLADRRSDSLHQNKLESYNTLACVKNMPLEFKLQIFKYESRLVFALKKQKVFPFISYQKNFR